MNKFFGALLVALFAVSLSGQAIAERKGSNGRKIERSWDVNLGWSTEIHPYIPSDLKGVIGPFRCNEQGIETDSRVKTYANCFRYKSESQNSSWIISYGELNNFGKKKTQVFKEMNGQNIPWVAFEADDSHKPTYMSAEAQRYAATKGVNDTDVAQSTRQEKEPADVAQAPQPAKENCAGKGFFDKAACELRNAGIERAVGAIIK